MGRPCALYIYTNTYIVSMYHTMYHYVSLCITMYHTDTGGSPFGDRFQPRPYVSKKQLIDLAC